ncbi:MAG: Bax inhibitor-1/YccA family protein [Bacilli bacterium]
MIVQKKDEMIKFFSKVYLWMFIGMIVSGLMAYYTSVTPSMLTFVSRNFYFIIIAELITVIAFSAFLKKINSSGAKALFIIYAIINGLTLSSIFIVYKLGSIVLVFGATAILFGSLAAYGYITKQDLTSLGKMMFFGLIAIIITSLVNLFLNSTAINYVVGIVSIMVFLGLTAWDMQKLKKIYNSCSSKEDINKIAIFGALELYLDFINLFLNLLRFFGQDND